MKKKYLTIGDLKRNAFIVAAAACMGLTSCGSNNQNEEWNTGEEVAVPDGVITELTEEAPDEWKITDERTTAPGQSMAILKYNDGRVDTLQGLELQNQMQALANNQQVYQQGGFGMSSVLWWSALGFMAGRTTAPRPGYYANPNLMNNTAAWRQNVQTYRQQSTAPRSGRSGFFRGRSGGAGA
ncbi:hypothetical protein POKO110462_02725 [Pontibacter korlensis]|uniref:UPF0323 domain-containing protein n=1 Tax=Pontibacter korlensis TaxID=400092 RepID=A0A0E3ZGS2_9BACT|nr:hypothetical protein [Pontibacter korlensis]AKD03623.1 hypothetical protein PKOR_11420 [Pontibacter korlensis]